MAHLFLQPLVSCNKLSIDPAMEAIGIGQREILENTRKNDLLVFLGNPASYFYHAVASQRDAHLVPIFATAWFDTDRILAEDRATFENVFLAPIVKATESRRNIVIIGHSIDGSESASNTFISVLRQFCPRCKLSYLNLITEFQLGLSTENQKGLKKLTKIVLPGIAIRLFNRDFVELCPEFPPSQWHTATTIMLNTFERQPEVYETISRISSAFYPLQASKSNYRLPKFKSLLGR